MLSWVFRVILIANKILLKDTEYDSQESISISDLDSRTTMTPDVKPTQEPVVVPRIAATPEEDHRWVTEDILGIPTKHVVYPVIELNFH